jgi:hypothetical protein
MPEMRETSRLHNGACKRLNEFSTANAEYQDNRHLLRLQSQKVTFLW